ncbi:VWA domain-containing protein [Pusillimonas sp.]|uniref:vWA domain-containing protein n=1 Tax=Pusillimonas sp. TaxID=3040095 RepID=UPI0037C6DE0B
MGITHKFQPLALALAVSVLLSACGGGGGDDESSNPGPPPQASEPVAGVLSSLLCNSIAARKLIYVDDTNPLSSPLTETGEQCRQAQGSAYAAIVDLVLFDKDGAPVDFVPDATSFTQDTVAGVQPFLSFAGSTKITSPGKAGAYSAFLAFDQSGSISGTDPTNQRIEAGTLFLQKNTAPDETALGFFPGSSGGLSYLGSSPQDMFSSDTGEQAEFLKSLAGKQNGGTPLYDALANAIYATERHSRRPNKAVVAFSDGKDTDSKRTIDNVISAANSAGMPLHMFALAGADQDFAVMQRLATETGGAMLYASSAQQLMAAYGSLGNLLRGNIPIYRLVIGNRGVVQAESLCKDLPGGELRTCNQPFTITAHTPAGDIPVMVNFTVTVRR